MSENKKTNQNENTQPRKTNNNAQPKKVGDPRPASVTKNPAAPKKK